MSTIFFGKDSTIKSTKRHFHHYSETFLVNLQPLLLSADSLRFSNSKHTDKQNRFSSSDFDGNIAPCNLDQETPGYQDGLRGCVSSSGGSRSYFRSSCTTCECIQQFSYQCDARSLNEGGVTSRMRQKKKFEDFQVVPSLKLT